MRGPGPEPGVGGGRCGTASLRGAGGGHGRHGGAVRQRRRLGGRAERCAAPAPPGPAAAAHPPGPARPSVPGSGLAAPGRAGSGAAVSERRRYAGRLRALPRVCAGRERRVLPGGAGRGCRGGSWV